MAQRATLILDAMGADLGAAEMLRGAALACEGAQAQPFDLVVVCNSESEIHSVLQTELGPKASKAGVDLKVVIAEDVIPKDIESPLDAYRRFKRSSVRVAMERAKETPHSAVVSPGSTGLVMIAARQTLGNIAGIDRAPIGTPMPTKTGEMFYVDGGANVDCRASHLYQFGVLAHFYVKNVRGLERPSIALLSNGSEDYKGTALLKEAYALFQADPNLNFKGYVEGHTMLEGPTDIMVCDGFIGNVLLKFAEGLADLMLRIIREELARGTLSALSAKLLQRQAWQGVRKRLDYTQFGGAPLLGLNGNVVICHGRSPAVAIKNALGMAQRLAISDMAAQVAQSL